MAQSTSKETAVIQAKDIIEKANRALPQDHGHLTYRTSDSEQISVKYPHPRLKAWSNQDAAILARNQSKYARTRELLEESRSLFKELGDNRGLGWTQHSLGTLARYQGQIKEAQKYLEQSLKSFNKANARGDRAWALHDLGIVMRYQKKYREAEQYLNKAIDEFSTLHNKLAVAWSNRNLARVLHEMGDDRRTTELLSKAIDSFCEQKHRRGIAATLHDFGRVVLKQGDYREATLLYQASLTQFQILDDRRAIAATLHGLALSASGLRDYERAAQLFGTVESLRNAIGAPPPPADLATYNDDLKAVQDGIGEPNFSDLKNKGHAMALTDAIAFALELPAFERSVNEPGSAADPAQPAIAHSEPEESDHRQPKSRSFFEFLRTRLNRRNRRK